MHLYILLSLPRDLAKPHAQVDSNSQYLLGLLSSWSLFSLVNSTQELLDSDHRLSPSLYLTFWDGILELSESLSYGYSEFLLVDALSMSSVNLGLEYMQAPGKKAAYKYRISSISSITEMATEPLSCETGGSANYTQDCHITLSIRVGFDRQNATVVPKMEWLVSCPKSPSCILPRAHQILIKKFQQEVPVNVGAWISLCQMFGWIFGFQFLAQ